jgi:hypothetical protein
MLSSWAYYLDGVSGMPDIARDRIMSLRTTITEFAGYIMASCLEVSAVDGAGKTESALGEIPRNWLRIPLFHCAAVCASPSSAVRLVENLWIRS